MRGAVTYGAGDSGSRTSRTLGLVDPTDALVCVTCAAICGSDRGASDRVEIRRRVVGMRECARMPPDVRPSPRRSVDQRRLPV